MKVQPNQVNLIHYKQVLKKKEQQQKRSALNLDISTKAKQLQREQQADSLALGAHQQAQKGFLSLQQTAEQAELSMDQMYEKNTLEQNQLNEQLTMGLEMSALKAQGQMQQARLKFAGTVIQGLLNFGKVYADLETERAANQKILDSGAWAFTNDYQVEYGGKAIVQREQQQLQAEVADELSIVQAAPGDVVTQEQLRGELGVDLTTQRFTNQLEVGEAAASIGFDLTRAYDPNFKITMPDGRKISAFEAQNLQEFQYVINALAQAVTAQYGLKAYADDVAAVQQYVPKLEAARNALYKTEGTKFISALENNRRRLDTKRQLSTSQILVMSVVPGHSSITLLPTQVSTTAISKRLLKLLLRHLSNMQVTVNSGHCVKNECLKVVLRLLRTSVLTN